MSKTLSETELEAVADLATAVRILAQVAAGLTRLIDEKALPALDIQQASESAHKNEQPAPAPSNKKKPADDAGKKAAPAKANTEQPAGEITAETLKDRFVDYVGVVGNETALALLEKVQPGAKRLGALSPESLTKLAAELDAAAETA